MFRTQVCFSLVCFSTICLFSSVGFSQDFYQPYITYSQPYADQVYSDQYVPNQFPTSSVIVSPVLAYDSLGVSTLSYDGSIEGFVIQGSAYEAPIVQGQGAMGLIIDPNYGYAGPGDMRTHLWNDHKSELEANGVSQSQLNSMSMATVQKWHNFFHGSGGRPEN